MLTIFDEQSREVEVYDVKPSKAEKVKKPFRLRIRSDRSTPLRTKPRTQVLLTLDFLQRMR